ncbi:MAG: phasin family protein [Gammaproteobacteria bacterium]|jgi:polyhydroxyalkanoate synthesis regulator protein|nr:phasin family protein [Gammaproteobacteria bacterium]
MIAKDQMNTFNELTNESVERMTALGELNMRVVERMTNRQMDLMSRFMEQGTRFMRAATEARGYNDLYKAQVEMTKEASEQMMNESKANLQLATEARDEYRAWYENTLSGMRKHGAVAESASA